MVQFPAIHPRMAIDVDVFRIPSEADAFQVKLVVDDENHHVYRLQEETLLRLARRIADVLNEPSIPAPKPT